MRSHSNTPADVETGQDGAPLIEAWTEQHPVALADIRSSGEHRADARWIPDSVRPISAWLRGEMQARIAGATGGPPIWLMLTPALEQRELCDWSCARLGIRCAGGPT